VDNPQDLVILDMVMPGGIDGTETYRRILEICPRQKAIILSGFSESNRVFEAQKLGAGAFVRKPITKDFIAAAVRTELDR
jgi:two-component system cell cycle sensor histidine kinase/response regulator CckA